MKRKQQLVRILALALVILLAGGTVLSVLVSALAEESAPVRDQYEMSIEYMEDEQALQITQRLVYHNRTGLHLDRVLFQAAANMFRRESAYFYENNVLEAVFPAGFAPAGIELQRVSCNGEDTDWGFQGTNEMILRAACDLLPEESCTFEFQYYLLLSESNAFIGHGETDVRLSAFYFIPAVYDEAYEDFVSYNPLQFTRWLHAEPADYTVTLMIPDTYLPAATGEGEKIAEENHRSTWRFTAENVREFALSFGKRWRENTLTTDSGVTVRILSNHRGSADHVLKYAAKIIGLYEEWLGNFPTDEIDLIQSDYPVDALNFPGAVWLPNALFEDDAAMESALRFCLAQQYLGIGAYIQPVADAWLSDAPCLYLSLLAVEETQGYDAFVKALNDQVLDSLRITIPGGLYITLDASLFTHEDYDVVVRNRGTVVMHETRIAMGRESLIDALRLFYEKGAGHALTEMDLVDAMNKATGGNWEDFLADWLYSVDEYLDQQIDFYE